MLRRIKGNIGIGVLAMPSALVSAGLLVGTAGLVAVALLTVHCMALLVAASQTLANRHKQRNLDYGEVVQVAEPLKSTKWSFKLSVLFIVLQQLNMSSCILISKCPIQNMNIQD